MAIGVSFFARFGCFFGILPDLPDLLDADDVDGVSFFARFGCFFGILPDLPDLLDADDVDELLLLLRRLYILSPESALSLSLPLLLLLMSRIAASRARRLRA